MKNNLIIGVILALVIGGALGFLGGMQYQKSQRAKFMTTFSGGNTQGGQFGQGQGTRQGNVRFGGPNGMNRPVSGEIVSADDKSITVKLDDGSSKIVLIDNKTSINKSDTATSEDLKTGVKVAAFGTTNSDGSVTAVSIQLNPQERIMQIQKPTGNPTE